MSRRERERKREKGQVPVLLEEGAAGAATCKQKQQATTSSSSSRHFTGQRALLYIHTNEWSL